MVEKSLSDNELIERFRSDEGKHYAFQLLVQKHQQKLYAVIRRLVIDHADTDDLLQNVWIKVWNNLEKYKGDSQLFTWFYRIAVNESLTFLKKKRRRFFLPIVDVEAELSNKVDQYLLPDGNEIERRLQKAILNLPKKQRLVFQMRYYDELSYREISKVLGTSEGALKASYHHAISKLEKQLKENI